MDLSKWLKWPTKQQQPQHHQIDLVLDGEWDHPVDLDIVVGEIDRWLSDVMGYNSLDSCEKMVLYIKPIKTVGQQHGVSALFGFKFDEAHFVEIRVRPEGSDYQWSCCLLFSSYAASCEFLAIVKPNYVASCEKYVRESDMRLEEEVANLGKKRKHRDVQQFDRRQLLRERLGERITKFAVMSQVCGHLASGGDGPYQLGAIRTSLELVLREKLDGVSFKYLLHILVRNGVLYPEGDDSFVTSLHFWEFVAVDRIAKLEKEREDIERKIGEIPKRVKSAQGVADRKKAEWRQAEDNLTAVYQDEVNLNARLAEITQELSS